MKQKYLFIQTVPTVNFPIPRMAGFRYRSIECQSKDFSSKVSYTLVV